MRSLFPLHPAALAAYAVCAVACTCLVTALPLQALGLAGACAACLASRGRRAAGLVAGALALAAVLTAVNPLLNTQGATVLATPFGRPYTLEALALGAQAGLMAASMLLWIAWAGHAIGSDALLGSVGRVALRLGLVASLTAQMVPRFARTATRVASARAAAGIALDAPWAPGARGTANRVREGAAVLSTVAADGLEGAMAAADSMEARGFGSGPRSQARPLALGAADKAFAAVAALLLATFLASAVAGAVAPSAAGWARAAAMAAYGAFAFLPALAEGAGEVRWLFLRRAI